MTTHDDLRPILRVADLETYFGVSRQTIHRWRTTGELDEITHYTPGNRPFWIADEVESWARSRSCPDPSEQVPA